MVSSVVLAWLVAEYRGAQACRSAESRGFWQDLPMPDESGQRPVAEAAPVLRPRADDLLPQPSQGKHKREIGGPTGPEPTRFGDWERAGRCIDF